MMKIPRAEVEAAVRAAQAPADPAPTVAVKSLKVVVPDAEHLDPELLELFIEEAKEEIATIERRLPEWANSPDDMETLITVRRSFHTLKGSGRMVGAERIGEFCWSIENLLNRLINRTLARTPPILEFILASRTGRAGTCRAAGSGHAAEGAHRAAHPEGQCIRGRRPQCRKPDGAAAGRSAAARRAGAGDGPGTARHFRQGDRRASRGHSPSISRPATAIAALRRH